MEEPISQNTILGNTILPYQMTIQGDLSCIIEEILSCTTVTHTFFYRAFLSSRDLSQKKSSKLNRYT